MTYSAHRFQPRMILQAVWLYVRFMGGYVIASGPRPRPICPRTGQSRTLSGISIRSISRSLAVWPVFGMPPCSPRGALFFLPATNLRLLRMPYKSWRRAHFARADIRSAIERQGAP